MLCYQRIMTRLRRLRLDRFGNVPPGTELRFNDKFNILLGQNGSGKTTLLWLISMIVRSDFSALAREEFSFEYELTPGDDTAVLRVKLSNERLSDDRLHPRLQAEVNQKDKQSTTRLTYDGGWRFDDGEMRRGPDEPGCFDPGMPMIQLDRTGVLTQFVPRAWQAHRFDESLDMFRQTIGNKTFPGEFVAYFRGPPALVFNPWERRHLPEEMIGPVNQWLRGDDPPSELTMEDRALPFLKTAVELMGFASAQVKVDLLEMSQKRRHISLGNVFFRFRRHNGDIITHESLSYGQKRMLIFYYYLALNPAVVVADELVNGLHHNWIEECIRQLDTRQSFLTSQNPLLLDYLSFDSQEQVRSSFLLCRAQTTGTDEQMLWANLTEDEATMFYDAYTTGIQYVSEILRTRGLW